MNRTLNKVAHLICDIHQLNDVTQERDTKATWAVIRVISRVYTSILIADYNLIQSTCDPTYSYP